MTVRGCRGVSTKIKVLFNIKVLNHYLTFHGSFTVTDLSTCVIQLHLICRKTLTCWHHSSSRGRGRCGNNGLFFPWTCCDFTRILVGSVEEKVTHMPSGGWSFSDTQPITQPHSPHMQMCNIPCQIASGQNIVFIYIH